MHPDAGQRVERAERLVGQQQFGLADQRRGPARRAAARRRTARAARPRSRPARPTSARACAAVLAPCRPAQPEDDVVEHPLPGQQPGVLEDDGDRARARRSAPVPATRGRARPARAAACSCPSRSARAARRTRPRGSRGRAPSSTRPVVVGRRDAGSRDPYGRREAVSRQGASPRQRPPLEEADGAVGEQAEQRRRGPGRR